MEEWNSACLSSCSRSDRPLVELCVEPAVFSRQCTGVSVPLRDVLSSTGLPSKWCAGIGFLSRADQEIGVFWNAAPHTRLRLEFPRETGLMLRCPWKVGKAFQTKQVNRPYCRDQEGRRGSDEVVPGTSVFPLSETGMSGNFGFSRSLPNTVSNFRMKRGTSLETLWRARASSCDEGETTWFFFELRWDC